MNSRKPITVDARKGKFQKLKCGESIRIINTYGSQCVDTWAFNVQDFNEYMSMEHTRATLDKMMPDIGDTFITTGMEYNVPPGTFISSSS